MTELRKRMIESLQLRGVSARTQAMDVRAVRPLAAHSHPSPDVSTEEARRQSFLSITHVKQYARRASPLALCGITCFFAYPRHRDGPTLSVVRAPREQKLPGVLRLAEVRKMLHRVRRLSDRVCLATLSSCGRRLQEGPPLQGRAIDRARLMSHVRHGQGGQDRSVPLPHRALGLLRPYWGPHRHPGLLFPAPGRAHAGRSSAPPPMPTSRLQEAFRHALLHSGIHTPASGHTLRHAWATPRREAGVTRRLLHASLGHHAPTTPSVSTPLTASAPQRGWGAIHRVRRAL